MRGGADPGAATSDAGTVIASSASHAAASSNSRAARSAHRHTAGSADRPAPTLMVQGTASGVGKSLLVTALCRVFARHGVCVVPFKAQNMSNNAAVTVAGGEIGRAQALQARAAGVEPDVRMNPVLLKPLADTRSDVVLMGRSEPELARLPWHDRRDRLWPAVVDALNGLRAEAELVVIEGAGSPAETNLRGSDIVNMAVARHAGVPVLLAADIGRGGAFAALYGTWALLDPADRACIRGFVLNRFRGDPALLEPAPAELRERTGVPVVGVVPYVRHALPEEDAEGIGSGGSGAGRPASDERDPGSASSGSPPSASPIVIVAVRFPHVSNFDDLDPVAAEPGVRVRWIDSPDASSDADVVVLPGTRNTITDLEWLWATGLAAAIRARCAAGVEVVGLCGGYQMLGTRIHDPGGVEAGGECPGLGLLDVETVLAADKTTRRVAATVVDGQPVFDDIVGETVRGYEIHHGRTRVGSAARAWLVADGEPLGAMSPPAWGAYLHGLFDDDRLRRAWVSSLRATGAVGPEGVEIAVGAGGAAGGWASRVDAEIDAVADAVEAALDMEFIQRLVDGSRGAPPPQRTVPPLRG